MLKWWHTEVYFLHSFYFHINVVFSTPFICIVVLIRFHVHLAYCGKFYGVWETLNFSLIPGGWLLVSRLYSMHNSTHPSQLPWETSYRGLANNQMLLTQNCHERAEKTYQFHSIEISLQENRIPVAHSTSPQLRTVWVKLSSSTSAVRQMFCLMLVVLFTN